jgi:diguanylate cyclase (GGDEF)-like protein
MDAPATNDGSDSASVMDESQFPTETNLEHRALIETNNRARAGIVVYPLLWLVVALTCGLWHIDSKLLMSATSLFVANSALRVLLGSRLESLTRTNFRLAHALFVTLALWNGAQWGVLCLLCTLKPELEALKMPMIISGAGILAGGTMIMAITPVVRVSFPVLSIAPVVVALLARGTSQDLLLAALCIIFIFYVIGASGTVYRDYWSAAHSAELLKQRARELEVLSTTDTLTKLRNRLYFNLQFDSEWKRACRQHQSIAVLLIDIDHFKHINDTYGHAFGDFCLQQTANILASVRRSGDIVARYGGEEFIIALPATTLEQARHIADNLLQGMHRLQVLHSGSRVPLTVSIGVAATTPKLPDEGFRLINEADDALYRAKNEGRDRCCTHQQSSG